MNIPFICPAQYISCLDETLNMISLIYVNLSKK
jgi:hypothetical protein